MDCVWVIRAADHVELTLDMMQLERGKGNFCVFDSLTIYDGKFLFTSTLQDKSTQKKAYKRVGPSSLTRRRIKYPRQFLALIRAYELSLFGK